MKAVEFIKQYGWEKAKDVIAEWSKFTQQYEITAMPTHLDCDLGIFIHEYDFESLDESDVCIKDLKQFVDAWELVNRFGGVDAINELIAWEMEHHTNGGNGNKDLPNKKVINRLKQAIELVESVNENQD